MTIAQVSDKGQITLPADVRKKLGLKAKSRVDIDIRDNEVVIKPIKSVRELSGIFHECARGKTTDWNEIREETMRIVAEEVAHEGLD